MIELTRAEIQNDIFGNNIGKIIRDAISPFEKQGAADAERISFLESKLKATVNELLNKSEDLDRALMRIKELEEAIAKIKGESK